MSASVHRRTTINKGDYAEVSTNNNAAAKSVDQPSATLEEEEVELNERQIRALKREARKRKWVKRLHYVNDRGQALCWVAAAGFLIYYTNFFRELWENPHRVFFFFYISMAGLAFNLAIMLYMTIYLPFAKGVPGEQIEYDKEYPQLVPIVTIVGFVSFFCIIFALWPIWGILTPFILFILFMGASMFMVFLPSGMLGTLIFWGLVIFVATASHLIPHRPVDGDHPLSLGHTGYNITEPMP